ncbi:MAG TPA: class I SAM-dependent methyltransferase [Opitutaceae bacterium]
MQLTKGTPERILEIGCATGQTLAYYKSRGAKFTAGVELVPEVALLAKARPEVDEVIIGNIEALELPYALGSFDLLIVSHVLEHVTDPWKVLARLVPLLRPGGQLIGSLPNVRCLSVTVPLLFRGRWDYREEGILDWTHYRFFTRHSIHALLKGADLDVEQIEGEVHPRGKLALINRLSFGLMTDLCAYTYNFSANRPLLVSAKGD